jgi:hypothetical protein
MVRGWICERCLGQAVTAAIETGVYRRPSLKTILGITKAKKELGMTALLKPFCWWPDQKRRLKREVS